MRLTVFIFLLSLCACKAKISDRQKALQKIEGNWLVVHPDHGDMETEEQLDAYGKIQDSVVALMGLKLISFEKDGLFRKVDSFYTKGRWELTDDMKIRVHEGGEGFAPFEGALIVNEDDEDSVLELKETIRHKNYKLPVIWSLKKIGKGETALLFAAASNSWRQIPKQPETEAQLMQRLKVMLNYYSSYYHLVDREASYFTTTSTLLPFKFYQHAIGLQPLEKRKDFQRLFYDSTQAARAHYLLEVAINRTSYRFPKTTESFVFEYATYMATLAKEIDQVGK